MKIRKGGGVIGKFFWGGVGVWGDGCGGWTWRVDVGLLGWWCTILELHRVMCE